MCRGVGLLLQGVLNKVPSRLVRMLKFWDWFRYGLEFKSNILYKGEKIVSSNLEGKRLGPFLFFYFSKTKVEYSKHFAAYFLHTVIDIAM